jgi:hypothetical protein
MENSILGWNEDTGSETYQRFGILCGDRMDAAGEAARKVNVNIYGSIAMAINGWTVGSPSFPAWRFNKVGAVLLKNVVAFYGSNFTTQRPFYLQNCELSDTDPTACSTPSNYLTDSTSIGSGSNSITAHWTQSNHRNAATVAAAYGAQSLWDNDGTVGAEICKRYENGVLTSTPLFDSDGLWPMNQRIIDAMTDAGRTPINVTTMLTDVFGAIPAACKAGGSPAASITLTYPDAGGNFTSGTTVSIAWQSQGITGNVDVKVSRDGGSTKTTLATVAYNSSPYLWTMTTPKSANVKFYVEQGATIGASTTAGSIKGRLTGIKP